MFIIKAIFGLLVACIVAVFAVLNRHSVLVYWNPLIVEGIDLPLYIVGLGLMALGFIVGAVSVWLNFGSLRSERRKQKKAIKKLQSELGQAKQTQISDINAAKEYLPTLSVRSSH